MGLNDPYDRSGQYSGGDTGPKVDGYGGTGAFGYDADRRDVAIGTMMGEGGPTENRHGYGGILDSIENRISAIGRGANYGQKNDHTLQGVATARRGAEYNAWSPREKNAYGHAMAGAKGKPAADQQKMYDQALGVYDDYYDQGTFKGSTMGGTFYQHNASLKGAKVGAYQRNMQNKFGSMPIGVAGHVVTGPDYYGPGSPAGRGSADYQSVDPAITGSFGSNPPSAAWSDDLDPAEVQSFTGQQGVDTFGTFAPQNRSGTIRGGAGVNGLRGGSPGNDMLFDDMPMASLPSPAAAVQKAGHRSIGLTMPGVRGPAPRSAPAPAAAPQIGPRESYWTPGPIAQVRGSTATGMETRRDPSGVIYDRNGAYGGGQAFGPDDPFGGLGYQAKGYADVVDSFDQAMGMTRTVKDRSGNVIDQMTVGTPGSQGEPTGRNESGNASVGDGSYAESSGRNDNNPQGIL